MDVSIFAASGTASFRQPAWPVPSDLWNSMIFQQTCKKLKFWNPDGCVILPPQGRHHFGCQHGRYLQIFAIHWICKKNAQCWHFEILLGVPIFAASGTETIWVHESALPRVAILVLSLINNFFFPSFFDGALGDFFFGVFDLRSSTGLSGIAGNRKWKERKGKRNQIKGKWMDMKGKWKEMKGKFQKCYCVKMCQISFKISFKNCNFRSRQGKSKSSTPPPPAKF